MAARRSPAGGEPVGAREQRDLDLDRRGGVEVAVDGAPVERTLVDEEAEHEVVAGQPATKRLSRSLVRSRRQISRTICSPSSVVPDEGDPPVGAHPRVAGLPTSCRSAPKRSASRGELVGQRLVRAPAARARPRRTRPRAGPPARSGGPAPRACGRRRRGGGSGSAPRRAGRGARAAPPAPGPGGRQARARPRARAPARAGAARRRPARAPPRHAAAPPRRVSRSVSGSAREAELGGERASRSGAQRVGLVGRGPSTQHARSARSARPPSGSISSPPRERPRHRVDREVAPREVLLDGRPWSGDSRRPDPAARSITRQAPNASDSRKTGPREQLAASARAPASGSPGHRHVHVGHGTAEQLVAHRPAHHPGGTIRRLRTGSVTARAAGAPAARGRR